jgi:hypothetical protein
MHLCHQPNFTSLTIVQKSHLPKETAGAKKVPLWDKEGLLPMDAKEYTA